METVEYWKRIAHEAFDRIKEKDNEIVKLQKLIEVLKNEIDIIEFENTLLNRRKPNV